jgi:hypothetical protein
MVSSVVTTVQVSEMGDIQRTIGHYYKHIIYSANTSVNNLLRVCLSSPIGSQRVRTVYDSFVIHFACLKIRSAIRRTAKKKKGSNKLFCYYPLHLTVS